MRIRKLLAGMLAAAMLASLLPSALAVSNPAPITQNGITLGKQAGGLAGDSTEITLDVVANTNKNGIAIQFVLDATQSMFVSEDSGKTYVSDWADALSFMEDKNIYAGLTIFGETAETVLEPTKLTSANSLKGQKSTLENKCITFLAGQNGTNVQAGIREGLNALSKADSSVTAKYLVLITDGGSFYRLDSKGNPVNDTYNGKAMGNSDAAELAISGRGDELADSVEELLNANLDTEAVNYVSTADEPLADVLDQIAEANAYTNFEKGIYAAAQELNNLPSDVKLVTVGYPYYKGDIRLSDLTGLAASFVDYAQSLSIEDGRFDATLENTDDQLEQIISVMYGQTVNVAVPAGSVITDVLGYADTPEHYNFDLKQSSVIRVSLSNADGTDEGGLFSDYSVLGEDGTVTFQRDKQDFLTIAYTKADDNTEKLTATLHQDLLRGQKLSITYTAQLVEYSLSAGTHVVDTNVEAYLTPDGTADKLYFPKPDVDYWINGDGGGGGEDIPDDDVPLGELPELNTSDHFAYIIGRDDGLVHPLAEINRAEVATIFFRMLTDASRNQLWTTTNPYLDVDSKDWFNNAISTLTTGGVVEGKPGNLFDPDASITRAEFATIAVRFFGGGYEGEDLFTDISGHWANQYINRAAVLGLINGRGDGTFDPDAPITRAEAMAIVNRTLGRKPVADQLLDGMITWPDNQDETTWYYADVQEATNSHDFDPVEAEDGTQVESWTELLPVRDWAALEKEWSDANSSENPGDVLPDYLPTEG